MASRNTTYANRPNNKTQFQQNQNSRGQSQAPANVISGPRLAYHPEMQNRFGIDKSQWIALIDAIFPLATTVESVVMALSYCRARNLDPFKRVVHIVPIYNRNLDRFVDTIWPSIAELRTTAFRTNCYAGKGPTVYGPDLVVTVGSTEVVVPEYVQISVYRFVNGQRLEFHGPRVYWLETYVQAGRNDENPNAMWKKRARGQLEKCAEAAALRVAFPEECGNDYIPEELERSQVIEAPSQGIPHHPVTTPSLDNLTSELEASEQTQAGSEESQKQETPASTPAQFDLDAVARDFAACKTLAAITELRSAIGNVPAEFDGPVASLEDQARERIREQHQLAKKPVGAQGSLPGT